MLEAGPFGIPWVATVYLGVGACLWVVFGVKRLFRGVHDFAGGCLSVVVLPIHLWAWASFWPVLMLYPLIAYLFMRDPKRAEIGDRVVQAGVGAVIGVADVLNPPPIGLCPAKPRGNPKDCGYRDGCIHPRTCWPWQVDIPDPAPRRP